MKVIPFRVPKTTQEAFRLQVDTLPYFYVGRFGQGDLFVISSGQPHVFRSDKDYFRPRSKKKTKSISLYFDEKYAGESFWQLTELLEIRQFLNRLGTGIRIEGPTKNRVTQLIHQLSQVKKVNKLILFLTLLQEIAHSKTLIPLSVVPLRSNLNASDKRMNDVLQFTFKQSHRKIKIQEVAAIANLSAEAFCRYFKLHTRKTYTNFLNEVRISHACKLLADGALSIQSVCYDAGFQNLSHFNRQFKRVTGKTPKSYQLGQS